MIDSLIVEFDKALRTVFAPAPAARPMPGADLPEAEMSPAERRHAAGLMRVNHSGEVCAQALYQGQAAMSHDASLRAALATAAWEETEHLNWTERRITALGGRKSLLNPLWYAGSLTLGLAAARFGDRRNLGFLMETERQVESHLVAHLDRLPAQDGRSRAVVEQMKIDEARHADTASRLGAAELPAPARRAMRLAAQLMTRTAYWV
ncbi:MAG: 2-polyprenyl-3-methyl-6-methoxy-1,4-benzoquinone monooxygenase [Rhodocyclaceae bacterium]|nr:2-polyprenyl-3-methyl-6-methoxy-1,4-benzoquinone monooxygenase [Rhodocyclaceae bacterium]